MKDKSKMHYLTLIEKGDKLYIGKIPIAIASYL